MDPEQRSGDSTVTGQEATARTYRQSAAAERLAADAEPLPNRRAVHLKSAEVWDERAQAIEDTLAMRRVNDAPKKPKLSARFESRRR